mmetsp:Transcript_4241/g.10429  ORF Transcript_4241/g.10429 Transcript_4241/m.10429 type:complete len:230 (+) Transcript_4241:1143-1832(+)
MRASRLEVVGTLNPSHQQNIAIEHTQDCGGKITLTEHTQHVEAIEQRHETGLVTSSVVNARRVAHRMQQVGGQLLCGTTVGECGFCQYLTHQLDSVRLHQGKNRTKRLVTVAHSLCERRGFFHIAFDGVQHGDHTLNGRGNKHLVTECFPLHSRAQQREVLYVPFIGVRTVELFQVALTLNVILWHTELEGRRCSGDLDTLCLGVAVLIQLSALLLSLFLERLLIRSER